MKNNEGTLSVQIVDSGDGVVWKHGKDGKGIACRDYVASGMQTRIVDVLKYALKQAEGQRLVFNVTDRIADIGGTSS
jgi:hypothetical protein